MLSAGTQKIKDAVERAFLPLRCFVEISRYEETLRFKVFDTNNQGIIEVSDLLLRQLRDISFLRDVISSARTRVTEKGFTIAPKPPD